jgi:glycosyltransferase involved in cell wall biosynthesis
MIKILPKLLYVSDATLFSESANSIQIFQVTQSLTKYFDVTLVTERLENGQAEKSLDRFYGFRPLFCLRFFWRGGYLIKGIQILLHVLFCQYDVVVSRNPIYVFLFSLIGKQIIYECHQNPVTTGVKFSRILKSLNVLNFANVSVICINNYGKLQMQSEYLLQRPPYVLHDAVDARRFALIKPFEQFLQERKGRLSCAYIGSFNTGKGLELIAEFAAMIPSINFHLYGGPATKIEVLDLPSIVFYEGFVEHASIPETISQHGILLVPYGDKVFSRGDYSNITNWMSPLKIFEYCSQERVIIASDIPAVREILTDGENALLVPPTADKWVAAITDVVKDPASYSSYAAGALSVAANNTWDMRAKRMWEIWQMRSTA